jgi:AraC-like DNA-binding protein
MTPLRVSVLVARAHLAAAAAEGIPLDVVLAKHGLQTGDLEDDEAEIDVTAMNALWREMERLTGEGYGLRLAEMPSRALGIVDYCARCAPDGRASLRTVIAYQRLLNGVSGAIVLDEGPAASTLRFEPPFPSTTLPRSVPEFVLARLVTALRRNTGLDFAPRRATFRHGPPADLAEHRRVLRCTPTFHAATDSVEIDEAILRAPVVTADPSLGAILDRHARELLARRPTERDLLTDVRRAILDGLRRGSLPDSDAVARRLATSTRTLRRRLDEAGTSLSALTDEVRRELAGQYLRDPALTTMEVAFLLGFSDASTFCRAFRRWTGSTPQDYRRLVAAPAHRLADGAHGASADN